MSDNTPSEKEVLETEEENSLRASSGAKKDVKDFTFGRVLGEGSYGAVNKFYTLFLCVDCKAHHND